MTSLGRLWGTLSLIVLNGLPISSGLTVNFLHQGPLHVMSGKTLILEAQFQLEEKEWITLVAWDRTNKAGEIRLVTNSQVHVNRTSVQNSGRVLRVERMALIDYGRYTVTVTNNTGHQVPKSVDVQEASRPPDVSLALKCTVRPQGALLGEPVFSWLLDGQKVTNASGELSPDGSLLYLSNILDRNYTCIAESSQGTNQTQIQIPDPKPDPNPENPESSCSTAGFVVAIVILSILLLAVSIVMYWKFKCHRKPDQRSY